MKLNTIAIIIGLAGLASYTLFAGGLAEVQAMKKAQKDVAPFIEEAEAACGTKLEVTFEGSFEGWNETLSLGGSCGAAAQGLSYLCAKDAESKAEGAKIKSLICKSGKTASINVNGNSMTYVMDIETGGFTSQQISDKLEKTL